MPPEEPSHVQQERRRPLRNATPQDARAGWIIFRRHHGDISLDELNRQLTSDGNGPVSPRMHTHYRHLLDAGFDHYISINRFDVSRAAVPYENASTNARYSYMKVNLDVSVIVAKRDRLYEAIGTAVEIGDTGATLRFEDKAYIENLRRLKPQPGSMVTVHFLDPDRTVTARLVDPPILVDEKLLMDVEYMRLISLAAVTKDLTLAKTVQVRYTLITDSSESLTIDLVGRRLYHFFELLEGARSLANASTPQNEKREYTAPLVLTSLTVRSPMSVVAQLPLVVTELIGVMGSLVAIAKVAASVRRDLASAGLAERQITLTDRKIELTETEIELRRLDLKMKKGEDEAIRALIARTRAESPECKLTDTQLSDFVRQHLIPPATKLGESGVDNISAEGSPGSEKKIEP